MYININCKQCDRNKRCHSLKIPDNRFLCFNSRPLCKLLPPFKEIIAKNGNISYDNKCKYQEEYPRPKAIKELI